MVNILNNQVDNHNDLEVLEELKNKVLNNNLISKKEALQLVNLNSLYNINLFEAANEIRAYYKGNQVDLCSIINAKSGGCSEDCKFCAQSGHYHTEVTTYPLIKKEEVLVQAYDLEKQGVQRFSLVTSGKGIGRKDFVSLLDIYDYIRINTSIQLCASHGIISYEQAKQLKQAGVLTYHHNLETSEGFYPEICTTHGFEERIQTIRDAQQAGLQICSGGIIGLGETMEDRIDMAIQLQLLNVQSVPINILTPITGTPLEFMKPLPTEEILKTIAIFRFILPKAHIRFAGGRSLLGNEQMKGFHAGISSVLTGNYLTTAGQSIEDDKEMLVNLGFELS